MDTEITRRMKNWCGGDWDETQMGAHVMRRKGCAMQNQGITLTKHHTLIVLWSLHLIILVLYSENFSTFNCHEGNIDGFV